MFSIGKTATVSSDDSATDSDDAAKSKRPRKQSAKEKSMGKAIERLRSIHKEKWGLGEYRLWATALVNKYTFNLKNVKEM